MLHSRPRRSASRPSTFVVLFVFAVSLAASACQSDAGPSAADAFLSELARLECVRLPQCDPRWAPYTADECRDLLVAGNRARLGDALDRGEVRLDPVRARACLDYVASIDGCTGYFSAIARACAREFDGGAFVGTLASGSACSSSAHCEPGFRCTATADACGRCVASTLANEGETCDSRTDCAPTDVPMNCRYDPPGISKSGICTRAPTPTFAALGEACDGEFVWCEPELVCTSAGIDARICVRLPMPGEECSLMPDPTTRCRVGYCALDAASSTGGRCIEFAVARTEGEPCGVVDRTEFTCLATAHLACDESSGRCVHSDGLEGDVCDYGFADSCAAGFNCADPESPDRCARDPESTDVCRP